MVNFMKVDFQASLSKRRGIRFRWSRINQKKKKTILIAIVIILQNQRFVQVGKLSCAAVKIKILTLKTPFIFP